MKKESLLGFILWVLTVSIGPLGLLVPRRLVDVAEGSFLHHINAGHWYASFRMLNVWSTTCGMAYVVTAVGLFVHLKWGWADFLWDISVLPL